MSDFESKKEKLTQNKIHYESIETHHGKTIRWFHNYVEYTNHYSIDGLLLSATSREV